MKECFLLIREERHVDDKYLIFEDKEDALTVAKIMKDYWEDEYCEESEEPKCSDENIIYYCFLEDAFNITVKMEHIRGKGEIDAKN